MRFERKMARVEWMCDKSGIKLYNFREIAIAMRISQSEVMKLDAIKRMFESGKHEQTGV